MASVCHCCKEPVVLDVIFSRVSCMDKLFGLLHREDYFILIELIEFFFFFFFFLPLPFPRGFQGFVYPLMVC